MKILIIGCGGIGSYLVHTLKDLYISRQLGMGVEIDLIDNDTPDINQFSYQKFECCDLNGTKAEALAQRFDLFYAIPGRITKESQLKGYELIILCVDNEPTRELVVKYCWKNHSEFIDLRANGSNVFAMPKGLSLKDNMKYIDTKDKKEYSCQDKSDLDKGLIQLGNRYIAVRGAQMILNYVRGKSNKIYLDTI